MNHTFLRLFRDSTYVSEKEYYRVKPRLTDNFYDIVKQKPQTFEDKSNPKTTEFTGTLSDCHAWLQLKLNNFL